MLSKSDGSLIKAGEPDSFKYISILFPSIFDATSIKYLGLKLIYQTAIKVLMSIQMSPLLNGTNVWVLKFSSFLRGDTATWRIFCTLVRRPFEWIRWYLSRRDGMYGFEFPLDIKHALELVGNRLGRSCRT